MKDRKIPLYYHATGLAVVICLSLLLNLYGIKWGLPDAGHFHPSFHPDETASLESSILILSKEKPLYPSPTGLGNGPMQFYVVAFIYNIAYGANLKSVLDSMNPKRLAGMYLTGRALTVIMSAGCAALVFYIAYFYLGFIIALASALFFVVLPATVTNSHYYRPDIPTTFWLLLAFLISVLIARSEKGRLSLYVLASVFAAFATTTKYNSCIVVLPLLGAHILHKKIRDPKIKFMQYFDKNLLVGVISFIIAFAVSSPGIFMYWDEFRERLVKQMAYQTGGTFMDSMGLGPSWFGYLVRILPFSLTWPSLVLFLIGLVYACWRRSKLDVLLLLWLVPYYLLISRSNWWVVRYTVPLMPFIAILSARVVVEIWQKLEHRLRHAILAAGALVFVFCLIFSFELDTILAAEDPRHQAYDYLDKNILPEKRIGFDFLPQAFFPAVNEEKHRTAYMRMNEANLGSIDYYVANDQIYLQFLRLGRYYPAQARYFRTIMHSGVFRSVARFENVFSLFGLKFRKVSIPHDYLYFMPRIDIYERVKNS